MHKPGELVRKYEKGYGEISLAIQSLLDFIREQAKQNAKKRRVANKTIRDLKTERDAALSTIAKVREVLDSEKFDVRESAFWVDGLIEVATVLNAIDGPTEQEKLQAEIDLHEDYEWDDDAESLICSHCKSLWPEDSDECPTARALGSVPSTGEGNE